MLYRKVWIWWGVFCPPPQTLLARRLHCQRENHSQVKGVAQKQKLINMRKLMLKTAIFIAVLTASLAVNTAMKIAVFSISFLMLISFCFCATPLTCEWFSLWQ